LDRERAEIGLVSEVVKFDIQTEGLGEFWGVAPNYHERRSRDPMSADELLEIILTILDDNGNDANGLFIIEHGKKSVHIRLNSGILEISNPNDANYQNVAVSPHDLKATLSDFFQLSKDGKAVPNAHIIMLEWIIAVVASGGMLAAVTFAIHYLNKEVNFMPKPDYMEVQDEKDYADHLKALAGIYVTEFKDGETLLSVMPDGQWEFHDLEKGKGKSFVLNQVEAGLCRPVYQKGRLALLTDSNFLFYWEREGVLRFQERQYTLAGKSPAELQFVAFPD